MQAVWQGYLDMPPVTRAYSTACVAVTLAVQLELISPLQLYFNWNLIVYDLQLWRLMTSFCYFGSFGFSFFFNLMFTHRYCQMLEEGSFRGKTSDFVFMFLFGMAFMIICGIFVSQLFLGQAFTIMLVYVWSRRNPYLRMNFFGVLNFQAPYLPWVILLLSILVGNNAVVDFLGIACGHFYYFLQDVFPRQQNGFKILETPLILKWLFDPPPVATVVVDETQRAGGFDWGINGEEPQPEAQQLPQNGGAGDN
ncbi:hypothetical protein L596_024996 [Steinernema carpocapsae]|uniref:Derlin n=1 Tax=Steinernema carpocapsae TaxID=34508 RepID=A0A4U5M6H4_STECR|nr:hypothetical protein L596_024996 [Steinernema carpocapsae]